MRNAILSGSETRSGAIYEAVARSEGFLEDSSAAKVEFLNQFAAVIAARGDISEMARVFRIFAEGGEEGKWWQFATVDGLAQGLRRHRGDLKVTSLAALLNKPPELLVKDSATVSAVVDKSVGIVMDSKLPVQRRLAAMPMLHHISSTDLLEKFGILIQPDQPPRIREAAFGIANRINRDKLADLFFERWSQLDPKSKEHSIALLVGNPNSAKRLMEKMKAGEINPALMDTMSRWRYQRSTNEELKKLAQELFGQPSGDRVQVLNKYRDALHMEGQVDQGKLLFTAVCSVCHKVDGQGNEIGPDLTDVRNKPAEALLSDILDPNRAVEARWTAYAVETNDDRTLLGLLMAETTDSVTVKGPGINETLPRNQIKSMKESGQSLMPVGLEGAINPKQMADLLAYLRKR